MAFQQSTQQATQRIARPDVGSQNAAGARSPHEQPLELSRTWVLFSPPTEVTATSYLTETERSIQTPGRSRLSDLGSLVTGAEAALAPVSVSASASASAVLVADEIQPTTTTTTEGSLADDAELDSLDGHLPGFRSLPSRNQHIFPSHDGLGSFRLDQPALGPDAQDHLYDFERFNPRRIHVRRRLNSFEQAQLDLEEAQAQEAEKRQRIEDWRLEHSKILLEEIQRETRCRQRLKASSLRRTQQARHADADMDMDSMDWHEQEAAEEAEAASPLPEDVAEEEQQSFLERITRVALRDLLDIDDGLLSILFGEELVSDEVLTSEAQRSALSVEAPSHHDSWQIRLLERVSSELGLLVNQLSRHPGAFSTYNRVQQAPLPFVGLPVIPEATAAATATAPHARTTAAGMATPTTLSFAEEAGEADFPGFKPTIRDKAPTPGRGSLSRKSSESGAPSPLLREATAMGSTFTQEEWERDVDIKLVFRYLVSRFTSGGGPESSWGSGGAEQLPPARSHGHGHGHGHGGSSKAQDAAAKAARLRYHPLISRARFNKAGAGLGGGTAGPMAMAVRHHSSCASQSTRRSARRSSGGSSRHYWDIGGSIKTGSVIASNGAVGTWGEG